MFKLILDPINAIHRHRNVLARAIILEIRSTYAGSAMGLFWVLLGPLLLMGLYVVIYAFVFKIRPTGFTQAEYVIYILCGLMPFISFSLSLSAGTASLSSNREVLLNTIFPPELLPVRNVIASGASIFSALLIVIIAAALFNGLSLTVLLIPLVLILQTMFVIGIVWILSLANIVLRDIQQIIGYLTIMLLIASPIAYTPNMISSLLRIIIYANPLSYYLISYQNLILTQKIPYAILAVCVFLSIVTFSGGYWVFRHAKQVFFDYA